MMPQLPFFRPFVLALLIYCSHPSWGHEGHAPSTSIAPEEQHRPTKLPDRIVLTWAGNPAYTQNVTWRTSSEVQHGFAEFAVATRGPEFVENAVRISAETVPFESDLGTYQLHSAKMAGLAPATKYAYRVGDGTNWSEWCQFRTASADSAPFSFVYFGDAQNDIRSMWSRVVREAHSSAPDAAFMLHAGDLINNAHADAQWGEWFGAGGWLTSTVPTIATPGNHEYSSTKNEDGTTSSSVLSKHWRPSFAFPEHGPAGLEESAYWIDYQGVRIISLNSNEKIAEQSEWLKNVLDKNRSRWTILTFHHPIFSSAQGRDNLELRKAWRPILERYRVDLVLQGHDHSYARTGRQVPESDSNLDSGMNLKDGPTVYVVSVSGPKQYSVDGRPFFQKTGTGLQLYQVIHVEQSVLRYEARAANGELYDSFEIHKQPGGANTVIEHDPEGE